MSHGLPGGHGSLACSGRPSARFEQPSARPIHGLRNHQTPRLAQTGLGSSTSRSSSGNIAPRNSAQCCLATASPAVASVDQDVCVPEASFGCVCLSAQLCEVLFLLCSGCPHLLLQNPGAVMRSASAVRVLCAQEPSVLAVQLPYRLCTGV